MTLDREDIEAIADAVARKLGLSQAPDITRIADLSAEDRRKYWKTVRQQEKGGKK